MTLEEIKQKINSEEYDFLRNDEHCKRAILIGLGGSYAYGTNVEGSDLDVRGVCLNTPEELLTNKNFEQFMNEKTDTVIYGFNKMIHLLSNCNPNVIEILGLKPEHYLFLSDEGKLLLENSDLFLSQKAVSSFSGYATAQLRRLENFSARIINQENRERHILGSIKSAEDTFKDIYTEYPESSLNLYIDKSDKEDFNTEIFIDVNFKHYPLRDFNDIYNTLRSVERNYSKIGKRNSHAKEHNKLGKHMMHLVRLYLMCLDILERKQIITYREKEHDFLMEIRNGKYLTNDGNVIPEFYEIVDEYESKITEAKNNTDLPRNPNFDEINNLLYAINYSTIINS